MAVAAARDGDAASLPLAMPGQFELTPAQQALLDQADRYARAELYPLGQRMDAEEWWPAEAFPKLGQLGYFGLTVPGAGSDALGGVALLRGSEIVPRRHEALARLAMDVPVVACQHVAGQDRLADDEEAELAIDAVDGTAVVEFRQIVFPPGVAQAPRRTFQAVAQHGALAAIGTDPPEDGREAVRA